MLFRGHGFSFFWSWKSHEKSRLKKRGHPDLCMFLCQKRLPPTFSPFAAQSFNSLHQFPSVCFSSPMPSVVQSLCALKCPAINWFLSCTSVLTRCTDMGFVSVHPICCGIMFKPIHIASKPSKFCIIPSFENNEHFKTPRLTSFNGGVKYRSKKFRVVATLLTDCCHCNR